MLLKQILVFKADQACFLNIHSNPKTHFLFVRGKEKGEWWVVGTGQLCTGGGGRGVVGVGLMVCYCFVVIVETLMPEEERERLQHREKTVHCCYPSDSSRPSLKGAVVSLTRFHTISFAQQSPSAWNFTQVASPYHSCSLCENPLLENLYSFKI